MRANRHRSGLEFAVLIIILNLIVDLIYGLLDPKVKQG